LLVIELQTCHFGFSWRVPKKWKKSQLWSLPREESKYKVWTRVLSFGL